MPDDFTQDTSTTGAVVIGDGATGRINSRGDVDWFAVKLQAGKTYRFDLEGSPTGAGTLADPYLRGIYNYWKTLQADTQDDDGGAGDNSSVFFTAVYNTTYYVAVGAGRNKTGSYKLLVEEVGADDYADNAGSVGVGGSVTGAIETPGDRDRFAVALEGGKTYRVDIGEAAIGGDRDFSSRLYDVRDAHGTVLTRVTHDGLNRLYIKPGVDDTYTFEVGGISDDISQTGHYTLTVQAIDGSDEYAADTGTAGAVSVGGTATGEIELPGDVDWFAAALDAGTLYQVEAEGSFNNKGTLPDPYLYGIYAVPEAGGPGRAIAYTFDNDSGDGPDSLVLFRAPATATYYVSAGANGLGTGAYTVSVTAFPGDEYSADSDTDGALSVGAAVRSVLEVTDDADWFAVRLVAETVYHIEARGNTTGDYGGSLFNPGLALFDGEGEVIDRDDDSGLGFNARLLLSVDGTDTYYIGVDGRKGSIGTYTLSVEAVSDDYPNDTGTGGALAAGGSNTGEIELPNDTDWFAIELVAWEHYRIDLEGARTGQGDLPDPYLRGLYRADGSQVPGTTNDDGGEGFNSRLDVTPAMTATYYIAAGAYGERTGTYTLSVSVDEFVDDYPNAVGTGATLAVDGTATGAVDYAGDTDWFAVTLDAGEYYRIHLEGSDTGQGTLRDPALRGIHDADGNLLDGAGNDDGGAGHNSFLDFIAPASDTYYIVAGAHHEHTGGYRLSLQTLADDHPATTDTTARLTVGSPASGEIERPHDQDWFAVELIAEQRYKIDLTGLHTDLTVFLEDPYLYGIHDSDGNLLPDTLDDDDGPGYDSSLIFTAPDTGTYYLSAGAYDTHTGTYALIIVTEDVLL